MKQDALQMSLLLDYYGELLSQKQRTCFDLYYNQDLSLSEIAAELGVSRQGVHELLSRAEASLGEFERVTGCIARDRQSRWRTSKLRAKDCNPFPTRKRPSRKFCGRARA